VVWFKDYLWGARRKLAAQLPFTGCKWHCNKTKLNCYFAYILCVSRMSWTHTLPPYGFISIVVWLASNNRNIPNPLTTSGLPNSFPAPALIETSTSTLCNCLTLIKMHKLIELFSGQRHLFMVAIWGMCGISFGPHNLCDGLRPKNYK